MWCCLLRWLRSLARTFRVENPTQLGQVAVRPVRKPETETLCHEICGMCRGVATVGRGGGGLLVPTTFETRVDVTTRFENEVAQIWCLFRFLWYFGGWWPHCRRFVPQLKNPWRRPWECGRCFSIILSHMRMCSIYRVRMSSQLLVIIIYFIFYILYSYVVCVYVYYQHMFIIICWLGIGNIFTLSLHFLPSSADSIGEAGGSPPW